MPAPGYEYIIIIVASIPDYLTKRTHHEKRQ